MRPLGNDLSFRWVSSSSGTGDDGGRVRAMIGGLAEVRQGFSPAPEGGVKVFLDIGLLKRKPTSLPERRGQLPRSNHLGREPAPLGRAIPLGRG